MITKSKTRLTASIFTTFLFLICLFIPVHADEVVEYPIWVGTQQITSELTSSYCWSYEGDEKGGTLTINDLRSLSAVKYNTLIYSEVPLTIIYHGSNVIKATNNVPNSILVQGDLTIKGDGYFYAEGLYNCIVCYGNLTIEGEHITLAAGRDVISMPRNTNVSIKNSSITMRGGEWEGIGAGTVEIANSNITFENNATAVSSSKLFVDNSTIKSTANNGFNAGTIEVKNGSNVTQKGNGYGFNASNMTVSGGDVSVESYNGSGIAFSNSLKFTGGTISLKGSKAIENKGNGTITLDPAIGIKIPEDGILSEDGKNIVDKDGNIPAEVLLTRQYNVKIKNDDPELISLDKENAFEGQTVTVSAKTHETGLYVLEGLTVTDESGKELPLTDLGNGKYSFTMPASNVSVRPVYDEATTYPILIEDISLHSRYTSGDGWSYDGDEKGGTLTLDNADLSEGRFAIYSNVPLTIVLKGENKISSNASIYMNSSSLEIKGEGSLSTSGNRGITCYQGDLTISGGATVKIEGEYCIYLYQGNVSINDSTVIVGSTNLGIEVSGGACSITNSTVVADSVNRQGIAVTYNYPVNIENSTLVLSGKYGIYVAQNLNITKGSKVVATCDSGCVVASYLTNTDSTIVANAKNTAAISVYSMTVNSGTVRATVEDDTDGQAVEFGHNPYKLILGENMVISIPENGKQSEDGKTIVDADGNPAKEVIIQRSYNVTVTAGDNGKAISSAASGIEGTTITLTATPDEGYIFKEWKVVKGGVKLADAKSATTTFTIGTADVEVKAIFAAKPTPAPQVTLKLDKKSASVICGNTTSIKATLTGSKDKITWKSSDTKIATVDANGKVTTKMAGTVTITASAAGKKAACTVTVLYKDVTDSKEFWYAPTNYLTKNGIVKGYDNQTLFKPANECSRAQMVTFLWRLAGQPNPKKTTTDFKDIKTTDYFYKPVLWAVENGITTGVSKEKFNPQGICTRAQTVTFLWRMAGKPSPKTKTSKFTDIDSKDYFYKATLWASEMKIVAGYDDNTFKPQGNCLRRQMVTFLYKYDKYVNGKG
jgi:hypothetical protein